MGAIVGMELGAPLIEMRGHVTGLKVLQIEDPQLAGGNGALPETDAGAIEGGIELLLQQAIFMLQSGDLCLQTGHFTAMRGRDQRCDPLDRAGLSPVILRRCPALFTQHCASLCLLYG